MQQAFESQVGLPWLVRLRWFALAGQIGFLIATYVIFAPTLPWHMIGGMLATSFVSNTLLQIWLKSHPQSAQASHIVGGILTLDTLLLAGLLGATGGATNPFSVLFLVHITLAATLLGAQWTLAIALLSILCFAALFLFPDPTAIHGHHHSMDAHPSSTMAHDGFTSHLHGMWIAFTLATVLVAFFVSRIARTIGQQRNQLAALRESAARSARLASLTTLAAGAAHELGTPLGTIAIAAHDLELALASLNLHDLRDDTNLILAEVERCRDILGKLASGTGENTNTPLLPLADLPSALHARMGNDLFSKVRITCSTACQQLCVPREHVLQSLSALIKNAADASKHHGAVNAGSLPITIYIDQSHAHLHFCITDHGCGMSPTIVSRAGEPFFTTKEPGRGLGLGLFLVRAFAESHGGDLHIASTEGRGTRVTINLALASLKQ